MGNKDHTHKGTVETFQEVDSLLHIKKPKWEMLGTEILSEYLLPHLSNMQYSKWIELNAP